MVIPISTYWLILNRIKCDIKERIKDTSIMKHMNMQDFVELITEPYDFNNPPRFVHYRKSNGGNSTLSLITSTIILTDDDFDITSSKLISTVTSYINTHATDDGVYIDGSDVELDNTIINHHANKIVIESKRAKGNIIIDGTTITYVNNTQPEDMGLRIFENDGMYAVIPIDSLGGGNVSLFNQYFRKLI